MKLTFIIFLHFFKHNFPSSALWSEKAKRDDFENYIFAFYVGRGRMGSEARARTLRKKTFRCSDLPVEIFADKPESISEAGMIEN